MFSTIRKISIGTLIISIFNIIGSITLYNILYNNFENFFFRFSAMLFMFGASIVLLLLSLGILGLCNDLEYQHDYLINKTVELKKRVEELEIRINNT